MNSLITPNTIMKVNFMKEYIPGSVTKSEMAGAYGISLRTFNRWLKTAGIIYEGSRFLPPKVVAKVIEEFGVPRKWEKYS